jgi:hypothetical protein
MVSGSHHFHCISRDSGGKVGIKSVISNVVPKKKLKKTHNNTNFPIKVRLNLLLNMLKGSKNAASSFR